MSLTAPAATDAWGIDGLVPSRHVAAASEDEVVAAIREANERREAVVLWGGGTRLGIGDPPERYDVALDLTALRGVTDHQPADLTVTVRAGTTLAELADALAAERQWWPVEAALPDRATVGGTIASAADGPSRYRYFHPRDSVIGVRAVLGDGTVTRAGGRVVKNVTGYDLSRLYSGTFGTLCAIVEVTLKIAPLPRRRLTLRADAPGIGEARRMAADLRRSGPPLDALVIGWGEVARRLGSQSPACVLMRITGSDAVVERLRREVCSRVGDAPEAADDAWRTVTDAPAEAEISVRLAYPPSVALDLASFADGIEYPGVGIAHLLGPRSAGGLRELRAAAEKEEGALIVERAPTDLRREVGTWGTSRSPGEIAQRLRALFDPNGVLAPGRLP